jgi:hypothetical protein
MISQFVVNLETMLRGGAEEPVKVAGQAAPAGVGATAPSAESRPRPQLPTVDLGIGGMSLRDVAVGVSIGALLAFLLTRLRRPRQERIILVEHVPLSLR